MHISSGVVELWTVKRGVFGFLDHSVYASAICYCKGPFTLSAEQSGADTPEYARSVNAVIIAAFHSSREVVFTRSRDPGNHQFTTCQWNALLSDVTINRHRDTEV